MRSLRMDTKLPDAASRMSRLQDDLYRVLERHNLSEQMFTKNHRRVVGYLLEALEPVPFREAIRHKLTMEANKPMRKQISEFCQWTTELLSSYMQWHETTPAGPTGSRSISCIWWRLRFAGSSYSWCATNSCRDSDASAPAVPEV